MKLLKSPKTWILLAIVLVVTYLVLKYPVRESLLDLVSWIRHLGAVGYLVYVAVYALGAILLIPGSILTLGAGFAWGLVGGSILVSVASTLGAILAFLIGRYFAREWVASKIMKNPGFQRIDKAVAVNGFRIVLLTRLSPVFPFTFQNYAYSFSGVSLRNYALASWIGMIPGTIMYVYLGSLITEITQIASGQTAEVPAQKILYALGLVVTVVVTVWITRIARKALAEGTKE